jgi:hypothetical protein
LRIAAATLSAVLVASVGCKSGGRLFGGGGDKPRDLNGLVRVLQNDPDEDEREEAAEQLGDHGDASVLPALQQAADNDPEKDVRKAARKAIEKIRKRGGGGAAPINPDVPPPPPPPPPAADPNAAPPVLLPPPGNPPPPTGQPLPPPPPAPLPPP